MTRKKSTFGIWPKTPPILSPEQKQAREQFMQLWHEILPKKYQIIETFNHRFPAALPHLPGSKTLEIGAGLGEHLKYEDIDSQEYICLEVRSEFCDQLKRTIPQIQIIQGDIQEKQNWTDQTFDRIIAVHVLEHLPRLPDALQEVDRLLKPDGVFDVVIPCEGGLAYSLARKISAQRFFEKKFKMDYIPIVKNEHVSTFPEIMHLLKQFFSIHTYQYFPTYLPIFSVNLAVGFRFKKNSGRIQPIKVGSNS